MLQIARRSGANKGERGEWKGPARFSWVAIQPAEEAQGSGEKGERMSLACSSCR